MTFFNLLNHFPEARPVHGYAGNTVIEEMNQIGVTQFLGHLGKQLLLIGDAVAVPFQIIVPRKTFVQESRAFPILFAA